MTESPVPSEPKPAESVFDAWSGYVVDVLQSESELAGELVRHGGVLGDAREALIRRVLLRILPSIYEVGSGEIVDSSGEHSRQMDIVIARRDFPSLLLPSGSKVFLIESVLATIEVKSVLNAEKLRQALENCASVSGLSPNYRKETVDKAATDYGVTETADGLYHHDDPLKAARFALLGRPPCYVFGFAGYSSSQWDALADAIRSWAQDSRQQRDVKMHHYPALIATEGCIAWRNAGPYTAKQNAVYLVGLEDTPLRFLVLHLLYTLHRKIPPVPDLNGLQPNLDAYIMKMKPPADPLALVDNVI